MPPRIYLLIVLAFAAAAHAQTENWLEVRSPHFTLLSNAGEADARRATGQFERMRSVFRRVFPDTDIDPGSPIIVLAVTDKLTFQALEPESYLAPGRLNITGLFLRAPEKNYVLIWLDAPVAHPIAPVYHEYTHLILSRMGWLPLWLSEGWAEFYQNTQIRDHEVRLGMANAENLDLLHRSHLLPLAKLFTVDNTSPYYREEDKGSVFYAESWALTYYLETKDREEKTHRLQDYFKLVNDKVDAVTAAKQAFGDLNTLQAELQKYIVDGNYGYLEIPGPTDVDNSSFTVRTLTPSQSGAARADFLAYSQRESGARILLDQVLRDDPRNVSARETKGFVAFRHQDFDEARRWYEEALKLNPQSFLANYYLAVIALNKKIPDPATQGRIEASLLTTIRINPHFAPAAEEMGILYAMKGKNEEAHQWLLKASTLNPGNPDFPLNDAKVLLRMNRPKDAIAALDLASKMAHTPEQAAAIENAMQSARRSDALRPKNQR
jgi:Tfp pilus assembly protein PilF